MMIDMFHSKAYLYILYDCLDKNDVNSHKGREGRFKRIIMEIIISENYDNDGQPLILE